MIPLTAARMPKKGSGETPALAKHRPIFTIPSHMPTIMLELPIAPAAEFPPLSFFLGDSYLIGLCNINTLAAS